MEAKSFPLGLSLAALLMIGFGISEFATSFSHRLFGLSTAEVNWSTWIGSTIGVLYFVSGLLVLTQRRKAAKVAVIFLIADVICRIILVFSGLYSLDTAKQAAAIIAGTAVVLFFVAYVSGNRKAFR
jgi:hypothetical protein